MREDFEASTFQKRPCYRYIRRSDDLPVEPPVGPEAVAKVKLFNPTGAGTWWLVAYDPATRVAYGVAEIHEREVGDIWMPELVDYRGRFGLPIERDLAYEPRTVRELLEEGRR